MDKMCQELINRIEKALGITFDDWQRKYLLDQPMLLQMRITGRRTGKTLVFIIWQLFESTEPLLLRNKSEILNAADWWCCETREDRALGHSYLEFYRHELRGIYEKLKEAGIVTREVIFHNSMKPKHILQGVDLGEGPDATAEVRNIRLESDIFINEIIK